MSLSNHGFATTGAKPSSNWFWNELSDDVFSSIFKFASENAVDGEPNPLATGRLVCKSWNKAIEREMVDKTELFLAPWDIPPVSLTRVHALFPRLKKLSINMDKTTDHQALFLWRELERLHVCTYKDKGLFVPANEFEVEITDKNKAFTPDGPDYVGFKLKIVRDQTDPADPVGEAGTDTVGEADTDQFSVKPHVIFLVRGVSEDVYDPSVPILHMVLRTDNKPQGWNLFEDDINGAYGSNIVDAFPFVKECNRVSLEYCTRNSDEVSVRNISPRESSYVRTTLEKLAKHTSIGSHIWVKNRNIPRELLPETLIERIETLEGRKVVWINWMWGNVEFTPVLTYAEETYPDDKLRDQQDRIRRRS